jgi:hypothetical protein
VNVRQFFFFSAAVSEAVKLILNLHIVLESVVLHYRTVQSLRSSNYCDFVSLSDASGLKFSAGIK